MSDAVQNEVMAAIAAGICVLPPRHDGTKRPDFTTWTAYQSRTPTSDEIARWYAQERDGLGVVCGAVSANLELFEFDDNATYEAFTEAALQLGLAYLLRRIADGWSDQSPAGGTHWYYRCETVEGNVKLARRPNGEKVEPLIETRGNGGYAVIAPSGGRVHATGKPYVRLSGGPSTVATITADERQTLFRLAQSFDAMPTREPARLPPRQHATTSDGQRPGDDYAARTTWHEILEPHGWKALFTSGGKTFWRRPGKDEGWSATTNYADSDLLYVFSSSTAFEAERGYGKFGAYCVLNHNGDFKAAASALGERGYGTQQELSRLAGQKIAAAKTAPVESADLDARDYPLTDTGNAAMFAALYTGTYRYDHKRGRWYRWDGHGWRGDSDRHARLATGEVARYRATAAIDALGEPDAKRLATWARDTASRARRTALLELAGDLPVLASDGLDWDTDPYLFGVANGVVDLRTGLLHAGRTHDYITQRTTVAYDARATAPRFERVIAEIFAGDIELVEWVRRMIGYTLTGSIGEHAFVVCYGTGGNGKSTLFTLLTKLLGEYAGTLNFSALAQNKFESHPTELAALVGRRFVTASEINEGQRLNEARIKGLTGGDAVTARFMRQDEFSFHPVLKLWLAVNHKPVVKDDSRGFWRRMHLLPFTQSFPIDQALDSVLAAELPGVLNWALRGCLDWQKYGLGSAKAITDATGEYRSDSDPLAAFIEECCNRGDHLIVRAGDLYRAYGIWAKGEGQRDDEMLSSTMFGRRIGERFPRHRSETGKHYQGIALTMPWQDRLQGGRLSV